MKVDSLARDLIMHLYLRENPRTLYLVTSSQEESNGRPRRVLVFRPAEDNPYQAVVEFLHKDQVNLSNTVRLTSRIVKGCLGLIYVTDGASGDTRPLLEHLKRYRQISSLP
jgi:hypothetical protein